MLIIGAFRSANTRCKRAAPCRIRLLCKTGRATRRKNIVKLLESRRGKACHITDARHLLAKDCRMQAKLKRRSVLGFMAGLTSIALSAGFLGPVSAREVEATAA